MGRDRNIELILNSFCSLWCHMLRLETLKHHGTRTKLQTSLRRHIQVHFLEGQFVYFDNILLKFIAKGKISNMSVLREVNTGGFFFQIVCVMLYPTKHFQIKMQSTNGFRYNGRHDRTTIIAYSISQEICTRFLLCCALLWLYIDWFSHIHQAYFVGTLAIERLPQCQQSNPDEYG